MTRLIFFQTYGHGSTLFNQINGLLTVFIESIF